jgi:hypothetical protein
MSATAGSSTRGWAKSFKPSNLGVEPPDVAAADPLQTAPNPGAVTEATLPAPEPAEPAAAPVAETPAPPPAARRPQAAATAQVAAPAQFTAKQMEALEPLLDEERGGLGGLQSVKITITTRVTLAADRQLKILARKSRKTQVDLLGEALNLLFRQNKLPEVG